MDPTTGLSLLAFLAVFLLFFGIDRVLGGHANVIESRLDRYASRPKVEKEAAAGGAQPPRVMRRLNRMLLSQSTSNRIATDLVRADLKLTAQEYITINLLAVLVGFVVMLFLTRNNLILALVGGIIGFYAPRFYVRQRQSRRLQAFNNQLGDTLILLANSLRSGYSLLQSMETVAKELAAPMSTEFGRVVREVGLGLTAEEALAHMLERINSEDLDLVITAINIQHEVGGNLAEILDTIAHTIRERVRIKGQIRALTASQRLSGNIVAILPIAVALVLSAINPGYISGLWTESCGLIMLAIGLIMIVSGYMVIRRITAIEV